MHTIKAEILKENKDLLNGILGEKFKLEMMVTQRSIKETKLQIDYQFHYQSQYYRNKKT